MCTLMAPKLHTVGSNDFFRTLPVCQWTKPFCNINPRRMVLRDIVNVKFPTLRGPSDICSDDYGHIYVNGQYSHNVHRLTKDGIIIDTPLSSKMG